MTAAATYYFAEAIRLEAEFNVWLLDQDGTRIAERGDCHTTRRNFIREVAEFPYSLD
jgi:hypothetical protein